MHQSTNKRRGIANWRTAPRMPHWQMALSASLFAALGACASGPEPALSAPPAPDGPVKNLFKLGSLATDEPKPKDFVVSTRPDTSGSQFLPVHVRPPARPEPVLSANAVKEQEAALDAIRKNHDAITGRKPAPVKVKAAKPKKPGPETPLAN